MTTARIAALLTVVGYVALVAGLAMVETWLALAVGGTLLMVLGFLIDDKRQPPQPPGRRRAGP